MSSVLARSVEEGGAMPVVRNPIPEIASPTSGRSVAFAAISVAIAAPIEWRQALYLLLLDQI